MMIVGSHLAALEEAVLSAIRTKVGPVTQVDLLHIQIIPHIVLAPMEDFILVKVKIPHAWSAKSRFCFVGLCPRGQALVPLFVYESIKDGAINFKVLNLGDSVPDPQHTGDWLSRHALMIQDHGSGNSISKTRTLIFRYAAEIGGFEKIFELLTHFTASPPRNGLLGYDSKLEFAAHKRGNYPRLEDIIVKTELVLVGDANPRGPAAATTRVYDPMEFVFIWDGKEYAGEFRLPEIASWYQEDPNRRRPLE
jgi:hypothetical protein